MHPSTLAPMALFTLLAGAVCVDMHSRRIPNWLSLAGASAGIALAFAPGGIGWEQACTGLLIGFAAMLPMHLLRALGAGDVKLMAAAGSFIGADGMPLMLAATFVAGGLLSLAVAAKRARLRLLLCNLRDMLCGAAWRLACGEMPRLTAASRSAGKMPYALAIAAGALAQSILAGKAPWLHPF
jgi:prepilin peptidase CpaA